MNDIEQFNQIFGIHSKKIEEFQYSETEEGNNILIEVLTIKQDHQKLTGVKFYNISSLRMNFSAMRNLKLSSLIVEDMSKNQLEGLNFLVEDYESGSLSFYCESFDILN